MRVTEKGVKYDADMLAEHKRAKTALTAEIERRLDESPRNEIVLYVHGFNETYETAAFTSAELCHFLGREQAAGCGCPGSLASSS